jgi:hypothetical protein
MCEFDRELMRECGGMDRQGRRSKVSSHERLREKRTGVSQLARLIPCKNKRERDNDCYRCIDFNYIKVHYIVYIISSLNYLSALTNIVTISYNKINYNN